MTDPQDDGRAVTLRVVLRDPNPGSHLALCEVTTLVWVDLPDPISDLAPVGTELAGRVELAGAR